MSKAKAAPALLHTKIKLARQHKGLRQGQLAALVGCTAGAVSQWEAVDPNKRTVPSLQHLYVIAEATGMWVGWFVEDERPADLSSPLCSPPEIQKMTTAAPWELTREEKIEVLVGEQLRHAQMDGSYLPDFFRAYFVRYDDWQIDKMYQYAKEDAQ